MGDFESPLNRSIIRAPTECRRTNEYICRVVSALRQSSRDKFHLPRFTAVYLWHWTRSSDQTDSQSASSYGTQPIYYWSDRWTAERRWCAFPIQFSTRFTNIIACVIWSWRSLELYNSCVHLPVQTNSSASAIGAYLPCWSKNIKVNLPALEARANNLLSLYAHKLFQ